MADKYEKNPLNAEGEIYNDLSCIDCHMCIEIAPNVFTRDDDEGYSYVFAQPITPENRRLAKEAIESCPTESIGDDG